MADSKLQTAKVLIKADIPTPTVYNRFVSPRDVYSFDWKSLPSSFALKPSRGLGGEGIIVVKKRALREGRSTELSRSPQGKPSVENAWITTQKQVVTVDDLKLHVLDILEGAYSMGNFPDVAFIQEYVGRHRAFRKYAYRGTPDIRVIVFKKVPIIAMLRLPTKESGGRANLHQGAIAVGVDIATGITTKAYWKGKYIRYKPDTKRKLNGIKIPFWNRVLETAVAAQIASGLGYLGVDVVLHPEKGPMVLEINARPGLQIQLANRAGLRSRLEKVEDLEVTDKEHGVRIARVLFYERFLDRVKAEESSKTISATEEVTIKAFDKRKVKVAAKIDTGAWRTSISSTLAGELGLLDRTNILWTKKVKSSFGDQERPVIGLTFWLAGRKIITPASVAKRASLKYPIIIGRKNLKGFIVNPEVKSKT